MGIACSSLFWGVNAPTCKGLSLRQPESEGGVVQHNKGIAGNFQVVHPGSGRGSIIDIVGVWLKLIIGGGGG